MHLGIPLRWLLLFNWTAVKCGYASFYSAACFAGVPFQFLEWRLGPLSPDEARNVENRVRTNVFNGSDATWPSARLMIYAASAFSRFLYVFPKRYFIFFFPRVSSFSFMARRELFIVATKGQGSASKMAAR